MYNKIIIRLIHRTGQSLFHDVTTQFGLDHGNACQYYYTVFIILFMAGTMIFYHNVMHALNQANAVCKLMHINVMIA